MRPSSAKVTNPHFTPQELEAKLQDERIRRVKAQQAAKQELWNKTRETRDLRVLSMPDYQLPLLEEAERYVASSWDEVQQYISPSKIQQYLDVVQSCVDDYARGLKLREESLAFLTPLGLGGLILQEDKEKRPYENYPGFSTRLTTTYNPETEGSRGATTRMEQVSKYLFDRCIRLQEVLYALSQIRKRLPSDDANHKIRRNMQKVLLSQKTHTHRPLPRPVSKTLTKPQIIKMKSPKRKTPSPDKPVARLPVKRRLFTEDDVKPVEPNQ